MAVNEVRAYWFDGRVASVPGTSLPVSKSSRANSSSGGRKAQKKSISRAVIESVGLSSLLLLGVAGLAFHFSTELENHGATCPDKTICHKTDHASNHKRAPKRKTLRAFTHK